jgi:hypothetical protein
VALGGRLFAGGARRLILRVARAEDHVRELEHQPPVLPGDAHHVADHGEWQDGRGIGDEVARAPPRDVVEDAGRDLPDVRLEGVDGARGEALVHQLAQTHVPGRIGDDQLLAQSGGGRWVVGSVNISMPLPEMNVLCPGRQRASSYLTIDQKPGRAAARPAETGRSRRRLLLAQARQVVARFASNVSSRQGQIFVIERGLDHGNASFSSHAGRGAGLCASHRTPAVRPRKSRDRRADLPRPSPTRRGA